jgi:uncharacterized repeat protein (TIGR03803 family)
MRSKKLSIGLTAVLATFAALFVTATQAAAQTETVLHSFDSASKDGNNPCGSLIFDSAGNLYGTTVTGGAAARADGTVYEFSPNAGGGWTEKGLHSFGNGNDGIFPYGNVIVDSAGNLYGTASTLGAYGYGMVYELTPRAGGGWTEKGLHSFGDGFGDGRYPMAGLIFDSAGNLYGMTNEGGVYSFGTVFELTPNAGGSWTEKVLYSFGHDNDGSQPVGDLIFDAAGNLYGVTAFGGAHKTGIVFELTPTTSGPWTESVLHDFEGGTDGYAPVGSLIFDAAGNLYGVTNRGGDNYQGRVFQLSPIAGGWTETALHDFDAGGVDGTYPEGGVIFDTSGNLYGTTSSGGVHGDGIVYELSPVAGGNWTETVLHAFHGADGTGSCSGLIFDGSGNLYGTTRYGGGNNSGTVFEITP